MSPESPKNHNDMVYYDYALAHQLRRCRIIQIIDENYTEYASGRSLYSTNRVEFQSWG